MSSSNLQHLTRSHSAIASKKRAKKNQVKEVLFDETARREFLTGFHKRKVAKADAARKKAADREKQERLETRREKRRMLKEQAAENAAQVEQAYGAVFSDDDNEEEAEWTGVSNEEMEQEYANEEVLATVAIVEDFDPDDLLHGPDMTKEPKSTSARPPPLTALSTSSRTAPAASSQKKLKPKKIRYETKNARRAEKTKQRARRTEKAELAGGKASRSKAGGKKGKRR